MAAMLRLNKMLSHLNASNQRPKTYAVFVCGPNLNNPVGDYRDMVIKLLKTNDNTQFVKFTCYEGHLPSFSSVINLYDGIIIPGSKFSAHSNEQWILNLKQLIKQIYEYNVKNENENNSEHIIKMVGICFGHQIIAHSLIEYGGLSGKNNKTVWALGIKPIKLTTAFHSIFKDRTYKTLKLIEVHRDAVLSLPKEATLLATSDNTNVEMYSIGRQIFCVQGHPEFDNFYLNAILEKVKDDPEMTEKELNYARKSMKELQADVGAFKDLILDFLSQ